MKTTIGYLAAIMISGTYAQTATPSDVDTTTTGSATTSSGSNLTLDMITVSGEGVERSLFDTTSSVAIINDDDLQRRPGKRSVKEIISETANVYSSSSVGAPTIRGQDTQGPNYGAGAFFSGTVPRAGINIDGRIGDYNELFFGSQSTWDAAQIEVFRGPQTTTQGANSIAGAIVVKTKDPTFTPEFATQLLYGSRYKKNIAAVISGPLIDNELAGRIAFDYGKRDTFVKYTNPQFDPGEAKLGIERKNLRAKLLWTPSSISQFEGKLTFNYSESEGPQQEIVNAPFGDRINVANSVVSWPIKTTAVIADTRYHFSDGNYLSNQLQWSKNRTKRVIKPATFGSADIDKRDISNETRFHFNAHDERISGFVGFFLRRTNADEHLNLRGNTNFDDSKKQIGVFSELTYQFNNQWSMTGSLRYQYDNITRTGSSAMLPGVALDYQKTFKEWLPKVSLAYHANDHVMLGASISKGYNPGGIGLSFKQRAFLPFKKETVWNYELFTRADVLENRLSLSANIFYSDFTNAQRNVVSILPGGLIEAISVNAEDARSYGMELGANWAASDSLQLSGSLGLLHTEIGRFTSAKEDFTGKSFAKAPNYTLQLAADWQIAPNWLLSANARRVSNYYSDDVNNANFHIKGFTTVNAKLSYQPTDNIEIFAYADNLLDEDAPTWINAGFRGNGMTANIVEPREFGIGLRATW